MDSIFVKMNRLATLLHEHVSRKHDANPLKGLGTYYAFETNKPKRTLMLSTKVSQDFLCRHFYLEICDTNLDPGKRESWYTYKVTEDVLNEETPEYVADCFITRFDDHLKPEGERMFPRRTDF